MNPLNARIGTGFDVHKFAPQRKLVLGGVTIPSESGLAGHSDADVVVHALMDALLGAANLGDIGQLFPDSDRSYKDADSCLLLEKVAGLIREQTFIIVNCDITVICELPKISPYRLAMVQRISTVLGIDSDRVSVKATTTEGLGFTGRKEGIAVQAVCLLYRSD